MDDQVDRKFNALPAPTTRKPEVPAMPSAAGKGKGKGKGKEPDGDGEPVEIAAPPSLPATEATPSSPPMFAFRTTLQLEPDYDPSTPSPPSLSFLPTPAAADQQQPEAVDFLPLDAEGLDGRGGVVSLRTLPDELIVSVLSRLGHRGDWASLARFGEVCRKAWMLTREVSIWRCVRSSAFAYSAS